MKIARENDTLGWRNVDIILPGIGTYLLEWNEDTNSVNEYGFEPDKALASTIRTHFEVQSR